jgi:hypothetical protein
MDVVMVASGIVCCQARVIIGRKYSWLWLWRADLVNKKRARMIERASLEIGCKGLIVQLGVSKLLFAGDEVDRQYQVVDIVYLKNRKAVSF